MQEQQQKTKVKILQIAIMNLFEFFVISPEMTHSMPFPCNSPPSAQAKLETPLRVFVLQMSPRGPQNQPPKTSKQHGLTAAQRENCE